MHESKLDQLIRDDERLATPKAGAQPTAARPTAAPSKDDTKPDAGLRLLHRVRQHWDVWPADDPALDNSGIGNSDTRFVDLFDARDGMPQRLGRFSIKRELGRGGFGVVLLAYDPKLDQEVALKLPRAETLMSEEARTRLAREASAATILSHPAIVPVYESNEIGPFSYISYGFCNGESLSEWFQAMDKKIAPTAAAAICRRLSEALQHAHSRGIIHRDLKPSNVLLSHEEHPLTNENGGTDRPSDVASVVSALRVADFGLARMGDTRSDLTRTGTPFGTPAYMSPEQARGETDIAPTTDIFALGVILFELLTGEPPFRRENDLATLRAIESSPTPDPRSANPAVPKDLAAICLRCLEKRPADRYASAQALDDDLGCFLDGHSVAARPVGHAVRLARWCRRNSVLAVSLGVALVSLMTGLLFSVNYGREARRSEIVAREQQQLADQRSGEALAQAELSQQAVDTLLRAFAAEPSFREKGLEEFKSQLANAAVDYYRLAAQQCPQDEQVLKTYVETLGNMALLLQHLGQPVESVEILESAVSIIEAEFPDDLTTWARFVGKLARQLTQLKHFNEAAQLTDKMVERVSTAPAELLGSADEALTQLVMFLTNASTIHVQRGDYIAADETIDRAIELTKQITGDQVDNWPAHKQWGRVLRTKCVIEAQMAEPQDLLRMATAGLRIFQELLDRDPRNLDFAEESMATLYQKMGTYYHQQENYARAVELLRHSDELYKKLIDRHPDAVPLYSYRGRNRGYLSEALFKAEEVEMAFSMCFDSIAELDKLIVGFPESAPLFRDGQTELHDTLAAMYGEQGELNKALSHLNTAIEFEEENVADEQHINEQPSPTALAVLGEKYLQKAQFLHRQGKSEEAATAAEKSIARLEPALEGLRGSNYQSDLTTARTLLAKLKR